MALLDGRDGAPSPQGQPIDMQHLGRQTLGDPALLREVLGLFIEQAISVRDGLAGADASGRRALAHSLAGAARAVGAFALADCAAQLEASPDSAPLAQRLPLLIEEARAFAAAATR